MTTAIAAHVSDIHAMCICFVFALSIDIASLRIINNRQVLIKHWKMMLLADGAADADAEDNTQTDVVHLMEADDKDVALPDACAGRFDYVRYRGCVTRYGQNYGFIKNSILEETLFFHMSNVRDTVAFHRYLTEKRAGTSISVSFIRTKSQRHKQGYEACDINVVPPIIVLTRLPNYISNKEQLLQIMRSWLACDPVRILMKNTTAWVTLIDEAACLRALHQLRWNEKVKVLASFQEF